MKLLFASDIHGSSECLKALLERYKEEKADKLVLLGDILYHGPRNDIPEGYAPKEVAAILNELGDIPLCVRGNCDSEVDQMMIDFPILAPYSSIYADGISIFCTHGHLYNEDDIHGFDVYIQGHTHIYDIIEKDSHIYVNTGSVTLPKNGNVKSYVIYEDKVFYIKDMKGNILKQYVLTN